MGRVWKGTDIKLKLQGEVERERRRKKGEQQSIF